MDNIRGANARDIGPMTEAVAEELNALLGRRKISAARLSKEAGIPRATLHRTLNALRAIDVDDVLKICDFLGESCSDLIERAEALAHERMQHASEANVIRAQFGGNVSGSDETVEPTPEALRAAKPRSKNRGEDYGD